MKRRYTQPLLLLVFLILATGIVAAGVLLYRSQRDGCRQEAERTLLSIADLKVSEISMWRKDCLQDAGAFYKNGAFSALVRRSIEQPQDLALQEELRTWITHFQATEKLNRVALLDAAGNAWLSVPDADEPLSSVTTQKAREALQAGQITFADFYANEYTQKVYLRLFVPILDSEAGGRPLAVVLLRIDPEVYLYPTIQRWPTSSETAETLLVRREGHEAVFLNELRFRKNTALALRVSLDSTEAPAVKAALHEEGIVEGVDYRGMPVLAAVCSVPDSPWFLVAKMDTAEVYAPMRERLWLMVIFAGILLYGVRAAWGFLWRQQHAALCRRKYEAEHKYRAIVHASADGIVMVDVETKMFKYPNPALCQLLGYTEQELRTMRLADIHPTDALRNVLMEFESRARGDKALAQNIPCLRKDGAIVHVDINVTNAVIDGRQCLVSIFRDITERRELERRESLSSEILGILNDSSVLSDAITRILTAIQQTTGFDAVGIRLRDGDDFPYFTQNGFSSDFVLAENTLIVRGPDGGPCRDESGNLSLECTCGLVLSGRTDPAHPLFTPNGSFWTNDSIPLLDLPADQDPRLHPRNRCIHVGFCSVALIPIRANQEIIGLLQLNDRKKNRFTPEMVHFFERISESIGVALMRKQAEDDLLHAKAELQQYVAALESSNQALEEFNHIAEAGTRAKSEFLANMSHEIRTPMTAILGYAEIMLEENFGRATREHVEVIKRNGNHLLELINNILDISKVEAGKMQIEPTCCSPRELVADAVSLMRIRADAKHLKLETDLIAPMPETVITDPLRLRQVLVNLLGNAIKFTDQGKVRITVRLIDDRGRPRLHFEVTDTGIGMNEDQLKKLFQPFTQADTSSARKFGGTGLGLCISKQLAAALGGDIEVRSELGNGSTFGFTIDPGPLDGIPMILNAQEPLPDRSSTTTAAGPDKIDLQGRVLLAEDGLDNQRLISFLLRKAGADLVVVENGQLAVETALAAYEVGKPFDVILMDMQMPVMDGYNATRRLREWRYAGPIIALTAHAMADDCQKCLDAGCNDYATKPIDRQNLLTTIARWVDCGRTHSDSPESCTCEH